MMRTQPRLQAVAAAPGDFQGEGLEPTSSTIEPTRLGAFSYFAGLLALFCLCDATVSAQTLHLPPHEKIVLKNGVTLLLLEKPGVPLIDVFTIVKAGAAADPPGLEGTAAVTAGLLRKGTTKRTAQQFAADLDFIGGGFKADVVSDYSVVAAEFLTKDMARGFELVFDALMHPTFPQAEVDKVLAQSIDGLRAEKDDPLSVLMPYYNGYLYGGHPYGRPPSGDEISLAKIKRDTIANFCQAGYAPGNTIVAIAGDFPAAELRTKVTEMLEAWPARAVTAKPIPTPTSIKGRRLLLIDKPDATQTYFAIGNVGIAETDPDRVATYLVNMVFGGAFTSELNEALRVKSGYTYGAGSGFDRRKVAGPFAFSSYTKNETTVPTIDLALQVLGYLHKNGITQEQLDSARSYIKGQYPPNLETSGQLAQLIATHEFYGLGDDEVNELEARLDAVTPEIAKEVIRKHFPAENLVFLLIGNARAIAPAVKQYATTQDGRKISDPGFWPPPLK
jgi:zinc protease